MYLISDTTPEELPLFEANTLKELAKACHTEIPVVCRIIRQHRTTTLFQNTPAHIYKITDS
jgi:hypothetical protein